MSDCLVVAFCFFYKICNLLGAPPPPRMLNRCFAVFPLIRLSGVMCREDLMRPFTKRRSLYSNLGKIKQNSKTDQGVENPKGCRKPGVAKWKPLISSVGKCVWVRRHKEKREAAVSFLPCTHLPPLLYSLSPFR